MPPPPIDPRSPAALARLIGPGVPPPAAPRRRPRPGGPSRKVPWGWLEWTCVGMTLFPALLFIPGLGPIRLLTRVGLFSTSLLAWGMLGMRGGRSMNVLPSAAWLTAALCYMGLMIFHPETNTILSGLGQIGLCASVMAPAFWGTEALASPRQVRRLITILLVCNAASALVGIGQVFRPDTFFPPAMNVSMLSEEVANSLKIEVNGRRVFRPSGLSDSPGAACWGGLLTVLTALGWALRPIAPWKRAACAGLAFVGMGVMYFSQARVSVVMLAVCLVALGTLFTLQGNARRATILGAGSVALFLGAFAWVQAAGGSAVAARFYTLFEKDAVEVYQSNRGGFLTGALTGYLPKAPFGMGLGRWGMTLVYLGDQAREAAYGADLAWVEIQIAGWIVDGGAPLLLLWCVALALALWVSVRVALRSRDPELAYWAAIITALNLSVLAACFSFPVFVNPLGMQFWLLTAALFQADRLAAAAPRRVGKRPRPS